MTLPRLLLRLALGRRLPVTSGEVRVPGLLAGVTVRRDRWGVPHVDAGTAADGWFGLGFCHGQDRAAQLDALLRAARGTLAELVGPPGLVVDRLSRRVGFRRAADAQLAVQADDVRAILTAYTAGVNAGMARGLPRKPHEFALVGGRPSPWEPADVLAFLNLQSFVTPANWDVELARVRILLADGPDAVRALDPAGPEVDRARRGEREPGPGSVPAAEVVDRLAADVAAFRRWAPAGGGSNNWAISGSRTASGKPVLANDPHLPPTAPPVWYLAHVRTPGWEAAGATLVGTPVFAIAHNGHACWGMTAGLTDNTDLVAEPLGPDGKSVRRPDGTLAPCQVVREVIRVRGRPDAVEEVVVTPRGPVVSPVLPGAAVALSLRAVWLGAHPIRGLLDAPTARDFETFRRAFAAWPALPLNAVYADAGGTIGAQLAGQVPARAGHSGLLPAPADAPGAGWGAGLVPFEEMPTARDPAAGFLATANNDPAANFSPASPGGAGPGARGPFLGADYVDDYRVTVIREELARQESGWTVADCQRLQLNVRSKPWEELRPAVSALTPADADARDGLDLLRAWDGHVTADSPAAAVFELFVAELAVRVAKAKAPTAWADAVGGDPAGPHAAGLAGFNLFANRRVAHLVRLVRDQPAGWFPRPWADEVADAVGAAVRGLRARHGPGPAWWHWGDVRPLAVDHLLVGKIPGLGAAFNLPRVPAGGDANTVSQAATRPLDPAGQPHLVATLRAVFDTADWEGCRFALAGGQSGNPLSPHYADLFEVWKAGDGVPIPWAPDELLRAAKNTLRLEPSSE